MGKKLKGAALRAKKRANEIRDELQCKQADVAERSTVRKKKNEELFVIDKKGHVDNNTHDKYHPKYRAAIKRKLEEENDNNSKKKTKKPKLAALDKVRLEKLLKNQSAKALQEMAKESEEIMAGKRHRKSNRSKTFDLWNDNDNQDDSDDDHTDTNDKVKDMKFRESERHLAGIVELLNERAGLKKKNKKRKTTNSNNAAGTKDDNPSKSSIAVEVAHAGQSYRPDPHHHEVIIQDAIMVELRRREAEEKLKTPLGQGLSEETKAILLGSDDESSDSDDDGNDGNGNDGDGKNDIKLKKRPEKLTKAQRNKQKRLRAEAAEIERARKEKKLIKSVGNLPRIKKEIKLETLKKQEKKEHTETKKKEEIIKRGPDGSKVHMKLSEQDPLNAPTFPVALKEELQQQELQEKRLLIQQKEKEKKREMQLENKEKGDEEAEQEQEKEENTEEQHTITAPYSTLRTIRPKGSLLTERMASFAARNLVAKRKFGDKRRTQQNKKTKYKVKDHFADIN